MLVLRYRSLSNQFIKTITLSNIKRTPMRYFHNSRSPVSVKLISYPVYAFSQTHHKLFMTANKEVHMVKSLNHHRNLLAVLMPCMALKADFMQTEKLMRPHSMRKTSFNWIAISSSALFARLLHNSRFLLFVLQLKWFFLNSQLL